jgi:hypothetical protein
MSKRGKRAPKMYTPDYNSGFDSRFTLGEASFPNEHCNPHLSYMHEGFKGFCILLLRELCIMRLCTN